MNFKKGVLLGLLSFITLLICSCESTQPLYKALKNNSIKEIKEMNLDEIKESYTVSIEMHEDFFNLSNGEYRKLNTIHTTKIVSCIDKFINDRFNISYVNASKHPYLSLITQQKELEDFKKDLKDFKVVFLVPQANILPGNYIKEYELSKIKYYAAYFEIILSTTALGHEFFEKYDFINNGDTIISVWLILKENKQDIEIEYWVEQFKPFVTYYYENTLDEKENHDYKLH